MLPIVYTITWVLVFALAVFRRRLHFLLLASLVLLPLGFLNAYTEEVYNPLRNIFLGEPWRSPDDWPLLGQRAMMWWLGCILIMLPIHGIKRLFVRNRVSDNKEASTAK
jgi:hypothetical protein